MKSGFKLALITLPIVAIGAGVLGYVVSNSPPPERIELAERAHPVRVITAETHAIVPTIVGFGVVAPARTFTAIAEVGGTVEYVNPNLRDGQILPAGAVLVRLSPIDFNLAIAKANANIRAAEAKLAELDVSAQNQHAALNIELEVLAVKAADLARAEALFTRGTLTQSARDAAQAAHLLQRQKVQGVESSLALIPTQHKVQAEQIAVYQTTLATAEINLDRSELTLPFAARVASHNVEVGQFLNIGQVAVSLDGIDKADVEVQISMGAMRDLMRSRQPLGQILPNDPTLLATVLTDRHLTAEVRLQLGQELVTWPAMVDRISDGIDQQTGTIGVVVRVQAAYGQDGDSARPPLTKGMFVDVALSAGPITGVVLPRSAVRDGQIHTVDSDNRLRIISADPQLVQAGIALFAGGIEEGARVVLSTPSPVVDGLLLDPHVDTAVLPTLLAQDAAR